MRIIKEYIFIRLINIIFTREETQLEDNIKRMTLDTKGKSLDLKVKSFVPRSYKISRKIVPKKIEM